MFTPDSDVSGGSETYTRDKTGKNIRNMGMANLFSNAFSQWFSFPFYELIKLCIPLYTNVVFEFVPHLQAKYDLIKGLLVCVCVCKYAHIHACRQHVQKMGRIKWNDHGFQLCFVIIAFVIILSSSLLFPFAILPVDIWIEDYTYDNVNIVGWVRLYVSINIAMLGTCGANDLLRWTMKQFSSLKYCPPKQEVTAKQQRVAVMIVQTWQT